MKKYFSIPLKTENVVNAIVLAIALVGYYLYQGQKYVDLDSFYVANMAKSINSGSKYDAYIGPPYELLAQYKNNVFFAAHNLIYLFHPDHLDIQALLTLVFIVVLFFFYRKYFRNQVFLGSRALALNSVYIPLLCTLVAMTYAPYGYASLSQASTPMYYGLLFYIFIIMIDVGDLNHAKTIKLVVLTAICSLIHGAYLIPVGIYFLSDFLRRLWMRENFKALLLKFLPLAAVFCVLLIYYLRFERTLAVESYEPAKMWPSAWLKFGDSYLASPNAFSGFENFLAEISLLLLLVLGTLGKVSRILFRNILISVGIIAILLFLPPFPAMIVSQISEIGFFRITYPLLTFLIIIFPVNIVILFDQIEYKKTDFIFTILFFVSIIVFGAFRIVNHRISHSESYFDISGFDAIRANQVLATACPDCVIVADSTLAYNLGPLLNNKFLAIMPNRMRHLMGYEKASALYEFNTKILRKPIMYSEIDNQRYVFIRRRNNNLNIEYDESEYGKLGLIYEDKNFLFYLK